MIEIPARKGKAVRVGNGQRVKVINSRGQQVVDTWAFNADDIGEFMSMEHSRVAIGRIIPAIGDTLVTNRRRPILTLSRTIRAGSTTLCSRRATVGATRRWAVRGITTTARTTFGPHWQHSASCRRRPQPRSTCS